VDWPGKWTAVAEAGERWGGSLGTGMRLGSRDFVLSSAASGRATPPSSRELAKAGSGGAALSGSAARAHLEFA
jgi:hypothetical protein